MQVGCVIQARLGSTRLPRKVLAKIGGWPMIKHVASRAKLIGIPVYVVCPLEDESEIPGAIGSPFNPHDMLHCYLSTARQFCLDGIMRLTGDCPLLDPAACRRVLDVFMSGHYDYVANDVISTYPDGLGCEMFTREALERAHNGCNAEDREHVTSYIIRNTILASDGYRIPKYSGRNLRCPIPFVEKLKLSVDTPDDLLRVQLVDSSLPQDRDYSLRETLEAARKAGVWPR